MAFSKVVLSASNSPQDSRVAIPLDGVTSYSYSHEGREHPSVRFIDNSGNQIWIDINYDPNISNKINVASGIPLTGTLYIE